ncbi:MAG: murein biosynthesis integral membrane protein MurJ, partial [Solirubrobacteraceae bacterium]|nr:murein biosynthesis integral membrane protein MurJ [Solirubrobacteraceae bacterium]
AASAVSAHEEPVIARSRPRVGTTDDGPDDTAAGVATDFAPADPAEPASPGPSMSKSEATATASAGRSRNTLIFSALTAFSRVAGLLREVLSTRFYGTDGAISAFTLAFQIPNLLRSLFADAALSAAFVPVFSDLLQQGRRKDAMKLAAELAWVALLALSAITAVSILLCPVVVPLFAGDSKLSSADIDLAVTLTQIMFPVVALLGINGLLVGILNAEDHFTIPALSPVVWNVLIMAFMVVTHVTMDGADEVYGYAVGVLVGTIAQLLLAVPMVHKAGFRWGRPRLSGARDPQVRQVLTLMIPVALGLGLVNFNLLINSTLGAKISAGAIRAIDAAFRLYMLPQGIFSVAIATVLFPVLSRAAARRDYDDLRAIIGDGMRQILVLLIPAAAVTIALAAPIIRLIYEGGKFTPESTALTTDALWVFSLTLPLNGLNLLLTRTFFALKEPWTTTKIAVISLVVNVIVSVALWKPLGVGGIVAGTVVANIAVVGAQLHVLRGRLGGSLGLGRTVATGARVLAAAGVLTLVVLAVDAAVRGVIGGSSIGLIISLALSLGLGGVVYVMALRALHVEEAIRLERALRARLGR